MDPYELEAWAFSLPMEERAQALFVVADAMEEAGIKTADTRRCWAEQMGRVPIHVKDPDPSLIGYFVGIEVFGYYVTNDGQFRQDNGPYSFWSRESSRELINEPLPERRHLWDFRLARPKNAWYLRKGHWNKRKALQKMSIEELRSRELRIRGTNP